MGMKNCSKDCAVPETCPGDGSLRTAPRTVHFPHDVVFQDCVRHGELERIGPFIRGRRVSLDTIYHSGMAAIHEAVLSGNLDCVMLLMKHGADLHHRDAEGWTPLHMACSDGFPEIARKHIYGDCVGRGATIGWFSLLRQRYLLSLGADREILNESGEKPADLIDPANQELLVLFGGAAGD